MEAGFNQIRHYYPKGSYVIRICNHVSGDFQGTVYFPQLDHSAPFLTAGGLIKQMEEDIEKNHYPQNTFEIRRWIKKAGAPKKHRVEKSHDMQFERTICSFLVQVRYFQNATWQGTIHWMEGKQTKTFRSEYELLKLIEEAAESSRNKRI